MAPGFLLLLALVLVSTRVHSFQDAADSLDDLKAHFADLTANRFSDGLARLLAKTADLHTTSLYHTSKVVNSDTDTNAAAINVHLSGLAEDQAYQKLTRLRMFLVTKAVANATQLNSLQNYVRDNLLYYFLANYAKLDSNAVTSLFESSGLTYRSLLIGVTAVNILAHNAVSRSSTLRLNHLACLDPTELRSFKGLNIDPSLYNSTKSTDSSLLAQSIKSNIESQSLPASIDWSTTDAVGPVLNQGTCGSCWTFAAVQVLQSRLVVSGKGNLTSLSEQQLTSCIVENGCSGGTYEQAWLYVQASGIVSYPEYPYTNAGTKTTAACIPSDTNSAVVSTTVYSNPRFSAGITTEAQMMKAVATGGPIAIAIATPSCFSSYTSGVLTAADCTCYTGSLDHAVTVVGYGTTPDGIKFWKVKNSWGAGWGQGGYILLERDANTGDGLGMCGLLIDPNHPETVELSSACSQSSPPSYCAQAASPIMYTNLNTTSDQSLNACVMSYSGEYPNANCTAPAGSLPVWAWVLIGIAIALGLILIIALIKVGCERYAPSDAWYNIFSKPSRDGYRLLSREEQAKGLGPVPNSDDRAFRGQSATAQHAAGSALAET